MSQRVIKPKINKQIELYRKEATILDSTTILDGTISSIVINPGVYTGLTAMAISIADPPTKATPDTATATATLTGTSITSTFTITTAGSGYNSVPTISFSGGGGSGASATAVLTTGTLTGITLVSGGSGYTSAPTIVISPPVTETATGVVNVLSATSLSVTPTNPTTNGYYSSAPTVSFTGTGTGSTTGTAVLTSGRVTSVTIGGTSSGLIIPTSVGTITIGGGGTGYNVIPNVAFTGGGGSGATATAVLTAGVVTSITLSPAYGTGLNYTSAPTVVIDPPSTGAVQATGTVVFVSASSITVTVSNTATNGYYTSAPVVTFNYINGATGTGAVGTAVLTSGRVTSVTMSGTMTGYAAGTLPTVTIAAPSGTQATATCIVGGAITVSFAAPTTTQAVATSALTGTSISSVSLTNAGWYYTTAPLVSVTGGAGSGAFITSTIKDGKVISFNIVSGGTGYTSSPTLTLTDAPAGVAATATLTFAGSKISGYTMTGGSGYKTAPTITIGTTTGTSVTAATFQTVLGGTTYVKKFSWDIQPLSLDECGIMRVLKRTYSPFSVSTTSSQPYKISVCDIQTNVSHRTIVPSGSPYIPKSGVLECEYPFYQVSEPISLLLTPQNLNRIVLRIDEDMSADIGLKTNTDFMILLHVEEKEPEFIEYGARNNIQVHQQPALAAQNYGGSYYGY